MLLMDLLLLIFSLCLSLAIFVPFTGVLVRFRANYNPKSLQLDPEGGVQPHTGPVISSYFGMLNRVYRLESWSGLYKGLMPTLTSTFIISFVLVAFGETKPRHGKYRAPEIGVLGTLAYSIGMTLIGLPTVILTYRAITTPHKLAYFKPMQSLRILLTSTERRRPWVLYLTPGLLAAEFTHVAYVVLILGTLRRLLLPALLTPGIPHPADYPPGPLAVYFLIVALSTVILTPLEVIATRLAIQRNHTSADYNPVSQEAEGDTDDVPEYSGAEEDVIGLRSEDDPYTGLVDCAKRILDEEGWSALYRAWWLTLLGGLASAFA